MKGRKPKTTAPAYEQALGKQIEHTALKTIQRILAIVCIESMLISSVLVFFYISKTNRSAVREYTASIDTTMQSKVSMIESIAGTINTGSLTSDEEILSYVDEMVEKDDQVSAVYSCYNDNRTIMSGGWEPPADFIVTEREWYQKAQETPDQVYISDPYVDEQTGTTCITLAKATYEGNTVNGVVGLDMYMDDLISMMKDSYKGSSYCFLTTADGTILTHPNKAYSMTADSTSSTADVNGGRYDYYVKNDMQTKIIADYKGGLKFGTSSTSTVTNWRVVGMEPLSDLLLFIALLLILNLVIYLATMRVSKQRFQKKLTTLFAPLESISKKVPKIADGILDFSFDEEKNSTEIANLTQSLNDTIASMRSYISQISDTVAAISQKDLTASIDGEFKGSYVEIKNSLTQIMDSLNKDFGQIREQADNVLTYSDELQQTTENVANSASQQHQAVADISQKVLLITDQTREITKCASSVKESADVTNHRLEDSIRKVQSLVDAMESIEKCSGEIAAFVDEIRNIADQTNLLSLNASIEAARAGDAGKGFAVVAGEISTLATSSTQASENIEKLIAESKAAVSKGRELVNLTSTAIQKGMDDSLSSQKYIQEIVDFTEKQEAAINTINDTMKGIADMVESTAASAQENTAISEQLVDSATNLKTTADSFTLRES